MKTYTRNGIPIIFSKVPNPYGEGYVYWVFYGDDTYFTKQKPTTDQEVEELQNQLASTYEQINYLRSFL
jgi:hypothetical protein